MPGLLPVGAAWQVISVLRASPACPSESNPEHRIVHLHHTELPSAVALAFSTLLPGMTWTQPFHGGTFPELPVPPTGDVDTALPRGNVPRAAPCHLRVMWIQPFCGERSERCFWQLPRVLCLGWAQMSRAQTVFLRALSRLTVPRASSGWTRVRASLVGC